MSSVDSYGHRVYSDEELPKGVSQNGRNIGRLNIFEKFVRHCVRLFSLLPLRVLFVFSDVLYFLLYWVVSYRLKVVRENLSIVFPDKSDKERKRIERDFYRHLCDYFFETIKAITISDEELRSRMVIRNHHVVTDLLDKGKSVMIYAAHFGNWEWFTVWPLLNKPGHEVHAFYQQQRNNLANFLTVEMRGRRNILAVESQHGFRYTLQSIRSGAVSMSLLIGDQCPRHVSTKHWLDFFGRDTSFIAGPEYIASKLNMPVVYPSFVSHRRGYYEVEYRLITEEPKGLKEKECTARFAALLEDDIRHLPHLWLWSHRRWKQKHEDFLQDEKG